MRRNNSKIKICILNGVARSGTSFGAAVINSLPNTFFFTETFRLPQYYQEMHGRYRHPFGLSEQRISTNTDFGKMIPNYASFEERCADHALGLLKDSKEESQIRKRIRKKSEAEKHLSYVRAFEIFYEAVAEVFKVSLVGGKTTFCHVYKNQMLSNIPNLKWIDIIRDVRAVMSSGAVVRYSMKSLGLHESWREQVDHVQKLPPFLQKRHLTIKYEDLISKKRETIHKIVAFLEIQDFDYDQWAKTPISKNDGTPFGSNSSFDESGTPTEKFRYRDGEAFDAAPLKRWESVLTNSQKWFLTSIYRDELRYLSYPVKRYFPTNPIVFIYYIKICLWRFILFILNVLKKALT